VKRNAIVACAVAVVAACMPSGAVAFARSAGSGPRTLCVGGRPSCYSTLQAAVDAAHDGDTIVVGPGTYAGGVTVDVSVAIRGSGARSTIIKGGGPVLTIGVAQAATEPTVSIAGVTITGGVASADGRVTFVGVGGGVRIPGAASGVGATVTIRDSVITGNRATPSSTVDSGEPCPGGANCPFGGGFGGGIADLGRLTLINTTVSNNTAGGGLASNAAGGGIWTATNGGPGALTLINSTVTGNTATVSAPNGRFAEGGAIFVQDGEAFTVTNSVISNNSASVTSSYPSGVDTNANTAGIHIGGLGSATIQNSRITGNVASASSAAGQTGANAAALGEGFSDFCVCGQTLVLKNDVINGNRASATGGDFTEAGSAVEIDGGATISNIVVAGNSFSATSQTGLAIAGGAIFALDGESDAIVMKNSVVRDNTATASSTSGSASVHGAGINNGGSLELHNVQVAGNSGSATGPSGSAQGGGIWNGMPFAPDGPTPHLVLDNVAVTRNALSASAGLGVQGGGLFTPGFAAAITNSVIARNVPDQCFGC
jgi:hypothetical protein